MEKVSKKNLVVSLVILYVVVGLVIAKAITSFTTLEGCSDTPFPSITGEKVVIDPTKPTCKEIENRKYYSKFFLSLVAWPYIVVALR